MAIDQHRYPPPTTSSIAHVGTYRRRMAVSLERMFENALDWEHLPHLHRSSFSTIECLDAGDWGWRARVRASAARGANASLIEDHNHIEHAEEKLRKKKCDAIVLNGPENVGGDDATIQIMTANEGWSKPIQGTKSQIAAAVIDLVEKLCHDT